MTLLESIRAHRAAEKKSAEEWKQARDDKKAQESSNKLAAFVGLMGGNPLDVAGTTTPDVPGGEHGAIGTVDGLTFVADHRWTGRDRPLSPTISLRTTCGGCGASIDTPMEHLGDLVDDPTHHSWRIKKISEALAKPSPHQCAARYTYSHPDMAEPNEGTREEMQAAMVADIESDWEWRNVSVTRQDGTFPSVSVVVTITDPEEDL